MNYLYRFCNAITFNTLDSIKDNRKDIKILKDSGHIIPEHSIGYDLLISTQNSLVDDYFLLLNFVTMYIFIIITITILTIKGGCN